MTQIRFFLTLLSTLTLIHLSLAQSFVSAHDFNDGYGVGPSGGGVSFHDFNGDGLDDLTFCTSDGKPMVFMVSMGDTFQVVSPPLVDLTTRTRTPIWVDYDNDGDKDLYVTSDGAPNRLYRNNGYPSFTDVTEPAGLPLLNDGTSGANFYDVNNDGYLDLYVINFDNDSTHTNYLYINEEGIFTDATATYDISDGYQPSLCAEFVDINNDRVAELYISQDRLLNANNMYQFNGQTYDDISESSQTDYVIHAMNVAHGDWDFDGDMDIYVTNDPSGNLFLNNDDGHVFSNISAENGTGFYRVGWSAHFFDCDNDTDLDLYVSCGQIGADKRNAMYVLENGQYSESPNGLPGDTLRSFGNATGDMNGDGLIDLAVNNAGLSSQGDNNYFAAFRNTGVNANNWVKIDLEGTMSNRQGVGTWIEIYTDSVKQVRYTSCGAGFLSQTTDVEHIGLGTRTIIDSIIIKWPSGITQYLLNQPINQTINIVEEVASHAYISILLEGPVNGNDIMATGLDIPEQQPFNVAPYFHPGLETYSSTQPDAVDWVLVQLRNPSDATEVISSVAGILLSDGRVVSSDGYSPLKLPGTINGTFLISVAQRTHLDVISKSSVAVEDFKIFYDFKSNAAAGTDSQKILPSGSFALWVGDANIDQVIDAADRSGTWNLRNSVGYLSADVNLDGVVDAADRSLTWNNRNASSEVIH